MRNDYDDTMKSDFQALKEELKERHDKRIADTPRRVQFAIEQLGKNEIEYAVKNAATGHIHAWRKSDGQRIGCSGNSEGSSFYEAVGYVIIKRYCKWRSLGAFEKQTQNYIKRYWIND